MSSIDGLFRIALWVGTAVVGGYHVGLQLTTIGLDIPMGFWETTYVARANAWPNQYQWEHYIDGHDGYGPGYPAFVRPLLWARLDVYVAHRLANLIAIVGACILVWRLLRRQGCGAGSALALTTVFYALNAGSYSVQARPDFLVLLAITAMLAMGDAVARGSLRMSIGFGVAFGVLTLAAFFTKGYSAFTATTVLASLTLIVGWRGGVHVSLLGSVLVGAGILVYASYNPLYYMEVFEGQRVQAATSFEWLRHQFGDFTLLACGPLLLTSLGVALRCAGKPPADTSRGHPARDRVRRYWLWQTLLAALALLGGLGWHSGAYLTYFFHLMLVPVIILTGSLMAEATPSFQKWLPLPLLANQAVLMTTAPAWPHHDQNWAQLRHDILAEDGRVGVDYLLEPIAREKPGAVLFGTGMTGYVLQEPFLLKKETEMVRKAREVTTAYNESLSQHLFGHDPVTVIYLDCLLTNDQNATTGFSLVPRNGIPAFFSAEMSNYVAVRSYVISPYYFSTNVRRQDATAAKTTIVKLVRNN